MALEKFEQLLVEEYRGVSDIFAIKSFRNVMTRVGEDALLALAAFQEQENRDVDVAPMSLWRDPRLEQGTT